MAANAVPGQFFRLGQILPLIRAVTRLEGFIDRAGHLVLFYSMFHGKMN